MSSGPDEAAAFLGAAQQLFVTAEALDRAQQDRRGYSVAGAGGHHGGVERAVPTAVALAEVEAHLQHLAGAGHSAAPIAWPIATAASPATRDAMTSTMISRAPHSAMRAPSGVSGAAAAHGIPRS